MKNVVFLSTLIPDCLKYNVEKKIKSGISEAANTLEYNIYRGLSYLLNSEPLLVNILPVNSFPQHYKELMIKKSNFTLGKR